MDIRGFEKVKSTFLMSEFIDVVLDYSNSSDIIYDFEDIGISLKKLYTADSGLLWTTNILKHSQTLDLSAAFQNELEKIKEKDILISINDYQINSSMSFSKIEKIFLKVCQSCFKKKSKSKTRKVTLRFKRVPMNKFASIPSTLQSIRTGNDLLIIKRPTLYSKTWYLKNILGEKLNTTRRFDSNKKIWIRFSANLSLPNFLSSHGYLLANIKFCDEAHVYVTLSRNYFSTFINSNFDNTVFDADEEDEFESIEAIFNRVFKIHINDVRLFNNSHLLSFCYSYLSLTINNSKYIRDKKCHRFDFCKYEELNIALVLHSLRQESKPIFFKNPFFSFANILFSIDSDRYFAKRRNLSTLSSSSRSSSASVSSISSRNSYKNDTELFFTLRKVFYLSNETSQTIYIRRLRKGMSSKFGINIAQYLISLQISLFTHTHTSNTQTIEFENYISSKLYRRRAMEIFDDFDNELIVLESKINTKIKAVQAIFFIFKKFTEFEVLESFDEAIETSSQSYQQHAQKKRKKIEKHVSRSCSSCIKNFQITFDESSFLYYQVNIESLNLTSITRKKTKVFGNLLRNFNILYDVVSETEHTVEYFNLLKTRNKSSTAFDKHPSSFESIEKCFKQLSFSVKDIKYIVEQLKLVLFLGNIELEIIGSSKDQTKSKASFTFSSKKSCQTAIMKVCSILMISEDYFLETISELNYYKPAKMLLTSLIKVIYSELIYFIIDKINIPYSHFSNREASVQGSVNSRSRKISIVDMPGLFEFDLYETETENKNNNLEKLIEIYYFERCTQSFVNAVNDTEVTLQVINNVATMLEDLLTINYAKFNISQGIIDAYFLNFHYNSSLFNAFRSRSEQRDLLVDISNFPSLPVKKDSDNSHKLFKIKHFQNYALGTIEDEADMVYKYKVSKSLSVFKEQAYNLLTKSKVFQAATSRSVNVNSTFKVETIEAKEDAVIGKTFFLCLYSNEFSHKKEQRFNSSLVLNQLGLYGIPKLLSLQTHSNINYPILRSLTFVLDFIFVYGLISHWTYDTNANLVKQIRQKRKISYNLIINLTKTLLCDFFGHGSEGQRWIIKRETISQPQSVSTSSVSSRTKDGNSLAGFDNTSVSGMKSVYVVYFTRQAWKCLSYVKMRIKEKAALFIQNKFSNETKRSSAVRKLQVFVKSVVIEPLRVCHYASRLSSFYCSVKIRKDFKLVLQAAILIQAFFRKVRAKCSEKNKLNGLSHVVKIQSSWRRHNTQAKFEVIKTCRSRRKLYFLPNETVLLNSIVVKVSSDVFGPGDEDLYELLLTNRKRLLLISMQTLLLVGEVGKADGATTLFCERATISISTPSSVNASTASDTAEILSGFKINNKYIFCDILSPHSSERWVSGINSLNNSKYQKMFEMSGLLSLSFPKLFDYFKNSLLFYKICNKKSRRHKHWGERLVVLHNSKIYWTSTDKSSIFNMQDSLSIDSTELYSGLSGGNLNTSLTSSEIFFESASDFNEKHMKVHERGSLSYKSSGSRSKSRKLKSMLTSLKSFSKSTDSSDKKQSILKFVFKNKLVSEIVLTPDSELYKYQNRALEIRNGLSENKFDSLILKTATTIDRTTFLSRINMNINLSKRSFIAKTLQVKSSDISALSSSKSVSKFTNRLTFIPRNEFAKLFYEKLKSWQNIQRGASKYQFKPLLYHSMSSEEYINNHSPISFSSAKKRLKFIRKQRKKIVKTRSKQNILKMWQKSKDLVLSELEKARFFEKLRGAKISRSTIKILEENDILSFERLKDLDKESMIEFGISKESQQRRLFKLLSDETFLKRNTKDSEQINDAEKGSEVSFDQRLTTICLELRKKDLIDKFKFKKILSLEQARSLNKDDLKALGILEPNIVNSLHNSIANFDIITNETSQQVLKAALTNVDLLKYLNNFVNVKPNGFEGISVYSQFSREKIKEVFEIELLEEAEKILQVFKHYATYTPKHKPEKKNLSKRNKVVKSKQASDKLHWPVQQNWACPNCNKRFKTEFETCTSCGYCDKNLFENRKQDNQLWLCKTCSRWNRLKSLYCENKFCRKKQPIAELHTKKVKEWYSPRSNMVFFDKQQSMFQFEGIEEIDRLAKVRRALYSQGDFVRYVNLNGDLKSKGVRFSCFGFISEVLEDKQSYKIVFETNLNESTDELDTVEVVVPHRDVELVPEDLLEENE